MSVISFFKSHYSIGKSILTLEEAGKSTKTGPDSIIDLALENNLSKIFLIEDGFSGFLEAYTNCQKTKIQLIYGLRITIVPDMLDKSEETLAKGAKYLIIARNNDGYNRLVKIWSAAKDGFYYEPRLDFKTIKTFWDEKSLQLVVPFYDSFLQKNMLSFGACVPDFSFAHPVFALENNGLPQDSYLEAKIKSSYGEKYELIRAKSIYYNKRSDFLPFLTFKCIHNRSTLEKPELPGMTSDEFCMESLNETNKQ